MAVTYPDVLSDLIDARERYEVDGVQFVVRLEPDSVPAGGVVTLLVHAQNALDQPAGFTVQPGTQRTGMLGTGLLGAGSFKFETGQDLSIMMAPGEVGLWRVPLKVPANAPVRVWDVSLTFKTTAERANRVRPQKASRTPGYLATLLDDLVGLGVMPIVGSDFEIRDGRKVGLKLNVTPPEQYTQPFDLTPEWVPAWVQSDMPLQGAAMREVNNGRLRIIDELGSPVLYEGIGQSAHAHLEGTSVVPYVGESLGMAKILTYTVGLFMHDEESQNAILVPSYMEAMRMGRSTSRPVEVVSWSGLHHVVRLSAAVSFGIIAKAVGRQPWSLDERRGVTQWVAQCIEERRQLQPEFLYLPLLTAALTVMPIKMHPDENPIESFKLLGTAWHSRYEEHFKQDAELQELVDIFNGLARTTVAQMLPANKVPASPS